MIIFHLFTKIKSQVINILKIRSLKLKYHRFPQLIFLAVTESVVVSSRLFSRKRSSFINQYGDLAWNGVRFPDSSFSSKVDSKICFYLTALQD